MQALRTPENRFVRLPGYPFASHCGYPVLGDVETPGTHGRENLNYLVACRLEEFSQLRRQFKVNKGKKKHKKR